MFLNRYLGMVPDFPSSKVGNVILGIFITVVAGNGGLRDLSVRALDIFDSFDDNLWIRLFTALCQAFKSSHLGLCLSRNDLISS